MNDHNRPRFTIKETPDVMNISLRNQKDWGIFILAIFYFLSLLTIATLLVGSAISLLRGDAALVATPGNTILLLVFGLVLFSLYVDPIRALDNAFLQEDIAISGSSITIARSGFLMFKKKKIIPIEKIRSIQPTIQLSAQGSILVDIFMNTLKYGKLSIVTRQFIAPIYQICRGLTPDEAITVLDKILEKFPQY
jgi:ABC-type multidrug transport system fused ATPase/permease subunit